MTWKKEIKPEKWPEKGSTACVRDSLHPVDNHSHTHSDTQTGQLSKCKFKFRIKNKCSLLTASITYNFICLI